MRISRWKLAIASGVSTVVVLDQLTKWWARGLDGPIDLIGSLRFNLAFNSGMAFSRFEGWGSLIGVVGVVIVVVLGLLDERGSIRAGFFQPGHVL